MGGLGRKGWRIGPWQRRLLIGLAVALTSQLYLTVWAEGFRVSTAAILYPALLVTMMRESHRPDTGLVTGLCVVIMRLALDLAAGMPPGEALRMEYPGGVFYLCYDCVLCLLIRDRRTASLGRMGAAFLVSDFISNVINLYLSSGVRGLETEARALLPLLGLAVARSFTAAMILWGSRYYHRLLLRQEHERRYQRLFLMTAELKNELYFLKKNSDDIEQVMTNAYRLYERLGEKEGESGELSALALSIARDVHEVKKDNLRIIRGIEGEVEEVYDQEQMEFQDLMHILENSTRRMLGENRASIRLECRRTADFSTQEHYRLLSILKNLVTNAIEAIQGAGGRGIVLVEERVEGDTLFLTVSDDGPGISERSMHNLFQVGYSTKFDPETGNINRGVGLPAVKSLTEELGGSVSVESQPGRGARFSVELPLHRVKGEKREK